MFRKIKLALTFSKPKIALAVSFSSITAYILCEKKIDIYTLYLGLGVYSFSGFAIILNQIQEWKYDKLMTRTRERPIPSNRFSIRNSYFIALVYVMVGILMFSFFNNLLVYLLVLVTLLFYNFVYTPLKRLTVLAIIPGAVVGAIPPLIGWAACNGNFSTLIIWLISFFFFIGQIPHFALLNLKYGKDFKSAGYPIINDYLSRRQIKNLIFIWVFTVGFIALVLSLQADFLYYFIFAGFLYLVISTMLWRKFTKFKWQDRRIFLELNLFFLLVMLVLSVQSFI